MNIPVYRGNRLGVVLDDYRAAMAELKALEQRKDELRDELIRGLMGRPALRVGEWVLRLRPVAAVPGKLVTRSMVGETLPGRRGYSVLDVVPADDDVAVRA